MSRLLSLLLTIVLFTTSVHALETKKPPKQYETRIYIRRQCLISEADPHNLDNDANRLRAEALFPALAGIFLPFLIEQALGSISAALHKAGDKETLTDSGRLPTYLYRLSSDGKKNALTVNPNFGCVLIVRGTFTQPDDEPSLMLNFASAGLLNGEDDEARRLKRLNDNGIHVSEIAALFEAAPKLSDDRTALLYESKFLEMNDFQGTRSGDKRQMAITIAITGSGTREDEPLLSVVVINLGEVTKGKILKEEELRKGGGRRSMWVGGLSISETSLKAMQSPDFPKPTPDHSLGIMPVNFEGAFTETDEGSKLLQFIANLLDSTKGDVSKALSSEILKDHAKAAQDKADAKEALIEDEEAAYSAYLTAEADRRAAVDKPEPQYVIDAKTFDRDRLKRVWCVKYNLLLTMGIAPTHAGSCP